MLQIIKYKLLLIVFLFTYFPFSTLIKAQNNDNDRSGFYEFGKRFYFEVITIPSSSLDSNYIYILFRVSYSLFLFQKTSSNYFLSEPVFEFEFKNSQGIIKKRALWTDSFQVSDYKETINKSNYKYGLISTKLPNDSYDINVLAKNQDNSIIIKQKILHFNKTNFLKSNYISIPLFLYQDSKNSDTILHPFLLDGNISFTSKTSRMLLITTYKDAYNTFQYFINNAASESDKKKSVWDEYINFSGQDEVDKACIMISQKKEDNNINISLDYSHQYELSDSSGINIGILDIELFSEQLVPGKYNLQIINPATKDTVKQTFDVEWENMPLSLKKPKYAANLMYYILTDSEYDYINSGSDTDILKKIIAYWKKNDPTPFSPYNEAMTEYFTRADYAFFNYQTISEKDGAKTDRGKIYILYGQPDNTERLLVDSEAIEVWKYKKLNKEFHFQTKSTGVFKLVKVIE